MLSFSIIVLRLQFELAWVNLVLLTRSVFYRACWAVILVFWLPELAHKLQVPGLIPVTSKLLKIICHSDIKQDL